LWIGEKIEHHRTLGNPGCEAIYYKGKRMEPDVEAVDGFMADTLWGVPIDDDVKSGEGVTYMKEDGDNIMIFNSNDLDTTGAIKKGYDHNS
jgi:hypothetical protein